MIIMDISFYWLYEDLKREILTDFRRINCGGEVEKNNLYL